LFSASELSTVNGPIVSATAAESGGQTADSIGGAFVAVGNSASALIHLARNRSRPSRDTETAQLDGPLLSLT
jgi:hypothetical protein